MNYLISLFVLFGVLLASGCRETDVRTLTVKVPAMVSEGDVQQIRKALSPLSGINKELVVFDVKEHKVTVTYDSMVVAHKNIEIAIAEAGFDANGIQAIRAVAK